MLLVNTELHSLAPRTSCMYGCYPQTLQLRKAADTAKGENLKAIYQYFFRAKERKLETKHLCRKDEFGATSGEEEASSDVSDVQDPLVLLSSSLPTSKATFGLPLDDNTPLVSTKKKLSNVFKVSRRKRTRVKSLSREGSNKSAVSVSRVKSLSRADHKSVLSKSKFYRDQSPRIPSEEQTPQEFREESKEGIASSGVVLGDVSGEKSPNIGGETAKIDKDGVTGTKISGERGKKDAEEAGDGAAGVQTEMETTAVEVFVEASVEAVAASQDKMNMLQRLAMNALHLSVPASPLLLRQRRQSWVQLSGHPGSLAPAGPGTIWKKRGAEPHETHVYRQLSKDSARVIAPAFVRELQYAGDHFIEMQDLLSSFKRPSLMDVKMGTRTFLEDEVSNEKPRADLYQKMVAVAPSEPTAAETAAAAVTKRRYMEFRDTLSSSRDLGFRVEAMRIHGSPPSTALKTVRDRPEVVTALSAFTRTDSVRRGLLRQLRRLRGVFERSPFFGGHEVIGSSLLLVYDEAKAGAWVIDFAKTRPLPEGLQVTHRSPWCLGNHEEGFLTGLDNLIEVMEEIQTNKSKKLFAFKK